MLCPHEAELMPPPIMLSRLLLPLHIFLSKPLQAQHCSVNLVCKNADERQALSHTKWQHAARGSLHTHAACIHMHCAKHVPSLDAEHRQQFHWLSCKPDDTAMGCLSLHGDTCAIGCVVACRTIAARWLLTLQQDAATWMLQAASGAKRSTGCVRCLRCSAESWPLSLAKPHLLPHGRACRRAHHRRS